jgi:hypothetical protein
MKRKLTYGIRGAVPDDAEESRTIPFVLSDSTRDRHGTILNVENWRVENYRKNPVVAYQHNLNGGMCSEPNPDFVIGKDVSESMFAGSGLDRSLVGVTMFEDKSTNPLAEKVFRKVLFGSLSRVSVGFMEVGAGRYGDGDEREGGVKETYYFDGQELLEYSVVNVPSNPNAGKRDMMRMLREESYGSLMYAFKELGGKFRLSQIEQMRVCDILDLLDGKDIDLKETDPEKVRKLLADVEALKDQNARLTELLNDRRTATKAN